MVDFYTKINELCRSHRQTQKQLYEAIGVTDAGMRKMYARNSCEVSLLEKIAKYFDVPITCFFDIPITSVTNSIANNSNTTVNDTDAFRILAAQLEEKDKQIDKLLQIIQGTEPK